MADDTKTNDQSGNPPVNPPDNNGSKADAHWQKIADDRFKENENLKKELDELKKKGGEKSEVEELRTKITAIETDKEKARLETEYPDIEPDLILGKSPEEQKAIVDRQRERAKTYHQNSIDVNPPQYSQSEIDDQIKNINQSNKNPIQKAQEVMKLQRLRREST